MVGRRGASEERLRGLVERRSFAGKFAQDVGPTVDRDHERADDLLRTNRIVGRRGEHASLLEHLLRVAATHANGERVGYGGRARVPLAASPACDRSAGERPQRLHGELHRQQPVAVLRREQQRLVIGRDGLAKMAEFELRLPDHRGIGDRIDPPLGTCPDAAPILARCDLETGGEITRGKRRQREVVAGAGHDLSAGQTTEARLQDDLPILGGLRKRPRRWPQKQGQQCRATAKRFRAVHTASCTRSRAAARSRQRRRAGSDRVSLGRPGKAGGDLGDASGRL